jgi:hypothetical protein
MRRLLIVLVALLLNAAPAMAASPYTSATALQAAEGAALIYWGTPACGVPQLRPTVLPLTTIGYTYVQDNPALDPCYSEISSPIVNAAPNSPADFYMLCHIVAHEIGHLALPGDYFTSHPSDPGESGDPNNIMFQYTNSVGAVTVPQCLTAISHPFVYDGRDVTVKLRRYPRSAECAATMFDRRGRRWAMQGFPCPFTDPVKP